MAKNAAKSNGPSNTEMVGYVEGIESEHVALHALKMEYMRNCKVHRKGIADILDDAKSAGLDKKSVKAVVKAREHERKAASQRVDLADIALQSEYDKIRDALGDLADTPLGQAANPYDAAPDETVGEAVSGAA